MIWGIVEMRRLSKPEKIMRTRIKYIAPWLAAAAIGGAIALAPIASANTDPLVPFGTDPQVPNLGYYESNSGHDAGNNPTVGSLDLPF